MRPNNNTSECEMACPLALSGFFAHPIIATTDVLTRGVRIANSRCCYVVCLVGETPLRAFFLVGFRRSQRAFRNVRGGVFLRCFLFLLLQIAFSNVIVVFLFSFFP